MALTKTVVAVNNISSLSTKPNITEGLTDAELQARFDKTGTDLKTYINDVLTVEIDNALKNVITTAQESATDEWLDTKQVFKKRISVGTLPNTATTNTAHGLTNVTFIRIEGICTNGTRYYPIPYVLAAPADNIIAFVNGANISVTTGSDRSTYSGHVTLYYTKN